MVSFIQAVILSIVQGITEWFPISSSGHLAIVQELFGFQDLAFDVYLHFASVLAVVILFGKDIAKLTIINKENIRYITKLIIALVPAAIVGFYYLDYVKYAFGNFLFMGLFFMIFGVLIYFTKYAKERKGQPSKIDSFIIGISQTLSLFPGVSRSGMTMGSGLILGLKKEEAVKFSFILAVPIILGATLLEVKEITAIDLSYAGLITSFTLTLFISLITIKLLIRIIKSDKFYLFGIYNFIMGFFIMVWSFYR